MAALLGHCRCTLPQFHSRTGRPGSRPGIEYRFIGSKAKFVAQVFSSAQEFEDVLPGSAQDSEDPLKQAGLGSPDAQDSEGTAAAMKREAKRRKAERLKARKAARRKERQAQIPPPEDFEFWNKFKTGMLVWGTVERIAPYGAFVDVDGLTALLHISQISVERLDSPDQVFTVGDRVRAMVLRVDPERGRLSLNTKRLEQTAGDMLRDPSLVYENAEAAAAKFMQENSGGEAPSEITSNGV